MVDLAPAIHRQRLVIEGLVSEVIGAETISSYLSELSGVLGMRALIEPITHRSDTYGWSGWIHWETSGAHFYAWESPLRFFSVDVYACKPFVASDAVLFTEKFLSATTVVFTDL
jgi:S-adenosylmethionine decarboxylase